MNSIITSSTTPTLTNPPHPPFSAILTATAQNCGVKVTYVALPPPSILSSIWLLQKGQDITTPRDPARAILGFENFFFQLTDSGRAHQPIGFFIWYFILNMMGPPNWVFLKDKSHWSSLEPLMWEGTVEMPCLESSDSTLSVEGGFNPKGNGNHGLLIASFTTLSISSSACINKNKTSPFHILFLFDVSFSTLVSILFYGILENRPLLNRIHMNIILKKWFRREQ